MRRNKYGAKPTIHNGMRYDSKAEAALAVDLDLQLLTGHVLWWLRQVPIILIPELTFRVDFVVATFERGALKVQALEYKGVATERWKLICKLWRRRGPFDMRVIYARAMPEVIPGGGQE